MAGENGTENDATLNPQPSKFWFIQRTQRTTRIHSLVNTYYDLLINPQYLSNSDNFVEDLRSIFDDCMTFALNEHQQSTQNIVKQVRFVLTSDDLSQPINLPFMTVDDSAGDRIFNYVINFAQSHKEIILSDRLHFHFQ